jgi:hypothetical protein
MAGEDGLEISGEDELLIMFKELDRKRMECIEIELRLYNYVGKTWRDLLADVLMAGDNDTFKAWFKQNRSKIERSLRR